MPTPLRVLLIEDSEDDADLLLRELRRGGYAPEWQRVDTADALSAALSAHEWDVITCDYVMPRFSAPAALRCLRDSGVDLPVIIVSGQVGEEVAVTAMKAGAHDYINKHHLARLVPAIERELTEAASRRARRETEATLRASEERYRQLVETLREVIFETDREGTITFMSPAIEGMIGFAPAEVTGRSVGDFVWPEDLPALRESVNRTFAGAEEAAEFRIRDRAGGVRWVRTVTRVGTSADGATRLRGILSDVSEQREAEEAYRTVFEQSLVGLAIVQDEHVALVNPALARIVGRPIDELVGRAIFELSLGILHPDERPRIRSVVASYLGSGQIPVNGFDVRLVRPDGSVRRVLTRPTCFRYRGRDARLVAYMDITERAQAEAAYRDIFEQSVQGLVVVQGNRYAMVNPAFASIFGLTVEECERYAMEDFHREFIHPEDLANLEHFGNLWLERGEVAAPFEYRLVRRDGTVRLVHCRATRIEFQGDPAALVSVVDLTDRRSAAELYRAVFERSLQGLAVLQQGRCLLVNPAMADIVGLPPDELGAMTVRELWSRFVHADDHSGSRARFEKWNLGGEVPREPYGLRLLRTDGGERQVQCQTTRVELGGAPAVLLAVADMTDRQRAEEAYRCVFEHSLQGLTVVRGARVLMANRAMEELTGYTVDEYMAMSPRELLGTIVHPDDQAAVRASYERALSGETRQRSEFRIVRKDGSVRHILTARSDFHFGDTPAVLVAHVDITDRWRAEEALRALNADLEARVAERTAQLEAAARELESFNYSVSHDLQAPLRTIDGYTRAVLTDHAPALPDEARRDLERVRGASQRMSELIDHLLRLSRVSSGDLRRRPVDLSALARDVADDLATTQPQRRVAVTVADGLRAVGDASLLRAVLTNLLTNAWKFTVRAALPSVQIGAVVDQSDTFFVRDNGVGFDMRDAGDLFRAFRRLHPASEFPGSGIGLATVARIVARHGGRVWAESVVDQGSTFYFSIPTPVG